MENDSNNSNEELKNEYSNVVPKIIENKNVDNNLQKPNHYTSTGNKIIDFLLGFFGTIFLYYLTTISNFWSVSPNSLMALFIPIIILVLLSILFFKIGRKFIAVGIIAVSIIPVLLFGSCLLLLASYH